MRWRKTPSVPQSRHGMTKQLIRHPIQHATAQEPQCRAAPQDAFGRGDFEVGQVWTAALELTFASRGAEPYVSRLRELFPQMITPQQMGRRGWTAVRALPCLDAGAN